VKRQLLATSAASFGALVTTACAQAPAPARMIIRAPTVDAWLKHDETDGDQTFTPQRWQVLATGQRGATVTFATGQAFTHMKDKAYKRDAKLDLAIGSSSSSARWRVGVASDRTKYAASDETAIVQAASRRAG